MDPSLSGYTAEFRYLWRVHMQSCLRRDVQCQISPSQFYSLITSNCHYCGAPPENETKLRHGKPMRYNGVDRVDNEKPYNILNLVSCCKNCNSMKSKLTVKEFLDHIERIYRHQH
jgi:5-methylcytosine-specific restriction endonuclease McrA